MPTRSGWMRFVYDAAVAPYMDESKIPALCDDRPVRFKLAPGREVGVGAYDRAAFAAASHIAAGLADDVSSVNPAEVRDFLEMRADQVILLLTAWRDEVLRRYDEGDPALLDALEVAARRGHESHAALARSRASRA